VSRRRRTPSHAPLRTSGARFWVTASVRLPHAGCGRLPQAWPQSATHVRGGWCGDGMPARLGDDAAEPLTAAPSDDAVTSAGRGTTGSNPAGTGAATSSSSSSSAIAVNVTAVSRHLDGACDGDHAAAIERGCLATVARGRVRRYFPPYARQWVQCLWPWDDSRTCRSPTHPPAAAAQLRRRIRRGVLAGNVPSRWVITFRRALLDVAVDHPPAGDGPSAVAPRPRRRGCRSGASWAGTRGTADR
jgi:hypothetical protein